MQNSGWVLALLMGTAVAGCLGAGPDEYQEGTDDTLWSTDLGLCAPPSYGFDHPCFADGIQIGEALYFNGSNLPRATERGPGQSCQETNSCLEYTFEVAETLPGARLRVAAQVYIPDMNYIRPMADTANFGPETTIDFGLTPPDSTEESHSSTNPGSFGGEIIVGGYERDGTPLPGPAIGTWKLNVGGLVENDMHYRMRIHLQAPESPSEEIQLPDLRIVAPFEIGFTVATATLQPGAPSPVATPGATCMAEEHLEAQTNGLPSPVMCLRFSMGLYNVGPGAFRLRADGPSEEALQQAGLEEVRLIQNVCNGYSNNCHDLDAQEGLIARWHMTHLHYHYQDAYIYDLYHVDTVAGNDTPELTFVGTSGKLGLDPADEVLEGWYEFSQGSRNGFRAQDTQGNAVPATQRISIGWGDVYDWNRAGNYIDFPRDTTGRPVPGDYVIRGITDSENRIVESNETNNASFAYFNVNALGTVDVLERGFGTDPWDPLKEVHEVVP